ncbi:MAG: helix-hairpin-helix domain-containing protein [Geobacteraceae bacterium]|nr:helix-hairpin-helix domain-containing protein [Geobacteraceae bacterium]
MKRVFIYVTVFMFTVVLTAGISSAADPKAPVAKPAIEKKADAAATAAKPAAEELIDINTATEEQLKKIAGIGDEYSKKIVAGRPYAKKDQLKSRKVIPDALYEKIKDKIIAKQPQKADKKK